jgi:hypothetical protein
MVKEAEALGDTARQSAAVRTKGNSADRDREGTRHQPPHRFGFIDFPFLFYGRAHEVTGTDRDAAPGLS